MSTRTRPWRLFDARLRRRMRLSPSFVRLTLHGRDLAGFADLGLDTRCKLVLPAADGGYAHLPRGADWLQDLRRLPEERRCPVRTYTVRTVRRGACEVDLDAVLHDHAPGPAGRWVAGAEAGAPVVLVGPDAAHPGPHGGAEWAPPSGTSRVLLAGDETAVPAIAAILEDLPATTRGVALLEVPVTADRWTLGAPVGVRVVWLPRDGAEHGSRLLPAVAAAADDLVPGAGRPATAAGPDATDGPTTKEGSTTTGGPTMADGPAAGADLDDDGGLVWDVPAARRPQGRGGDDLYAWVAGEAAVVAGLRRHLVHERGVDRDRVAFMGYWRRGVAGG